MTPEQRQDAQEAFTRERCDMVVATVAFGMGIDRSNVRFVLHAAMPKSLEHYQQETGRAGRDGLEAECVLLHSGGRLPVAQVDPGEVGGRGGGRPVVPAQRPQHLDDMDRYARGAVCRHRALVEYFGQHVRRPSRAAPATCAWATPRRWPRRRWWRRRSCRAWPA